MEELEGGRKTVRKMEDVGAVSITDGDFCFSVDLVLMMLLAGKVIQTETFHLHHHDNIVPQSSGAIDPNCVDLGGRLQDPSGPLLSKHGHAGEQVGRRAEQGELELHS